MIQLGTRTNIMNLASHNKTIDMYQQHLNSKNQPQYRNRIGVIILIVFIAMQLGIQWGTRPNIMNLASHNEMMYQQDINLKSQTTSMQPYRIHYPYCLYWNTNEWSSVLHKQMLWIWLVKTNRWINNFVIQR